MLRIEGSIDAYVAMAISRARQLITDHGGSPEEVESFVEYYRVELAEWKTEHLAEIEHDLRAWLSTPPDTAEPRPPGTPLH